MANRESKVALDGLRDSKKVLLAPFGSKKFSGTLGSERRFKRNLLLIGYRANSQAIDGMGKRRAKMEPKGPFWVLTRPYQTLRIARNWRERDGRKKRGKE